MFPLAPGHTHRVESVVLPPVFEFLFDPAADYSSTICRINS